MTYRPLAVLALCAGVAGATEFQLPPQAGELARSARALAARTAAPPALAAAPSTPAFGREAAGLGFGDALKKGLWGGGRGEPIAQAEHGIRALAPIDQGFKALGQPGQAGSVDGPGRQGNGRYRVVESGPSKVVLWMRTGYIDGTFTLAREASTGKDTLRFAGRLWDNEAGVWGPYKDGTNDGVITYDPGADSGRIKWREDGAWKDEGYWGGRAGRSSMTIEFGGGWDHDFSRD